MQRVLKAIVRIVWPLTWPVRWYWVHSERQLGKRLVVLLTGSFERAEIDVARTHAIAGTTAIDVGANVGIFAVPLALAVGPQGRVIAVEPSPENVEQLEY